MQDVTAARMDVVCNAQRLFLGHAREQENYYYKVLQIRYFEKFKSYLVVFPHAFVVSSRTLFRTRGLSHYCSKLFQQQCVLNICDRDF